MDDADYITLPTLDCSHCECARPADYLINPRANMPQPDEPGCASTFACIVFGVLALLWGVAAVASWLSGGAF